MKEILDFVASVIMLQGLLITFKLFKVIPFGWLAVLLPTILPLSAGCIWILGWTLFWGGVYLIDRLNRKKRR